MNKPISTGQTQANIANVMALLADTPTRLMALTEQLSDAQLRQPLGAGERSFSEDLAHLLNCEARTAEAIYLALLANEPLFVDLHPERKWGRLMQYQQHTYAELLTYFRFRRVVLLRVLASLTEAQWSRSVREESKKRQESVYWKARALALHEAEHLADLERKLKTSAPSIKLPTMLPAKKVKK